MCLGGEGGIQTFFSDANKIKDLASHILVKIAQGHQKGHQKILKELTITNNELVKRVYRKKGRISVLPDLNDAVLHFIACLFTKKRSL